MSSKMTIRQKTLLLTILILAGSLLLVFLITRSIIISEVSPLESRQLSDRLKIVTYLLEQKQRDLGKWVVDWADWDDAYDFMKTGASKFITIDLSPSYFKVYDIEHLLFMLPDGRPRYACSYTFSDQSRRRLSPLLLEKLKELATLGSRKGTVEATSGLFRLGGTFYVASTHPVLTSKAQGPSRGMLVFANELEEAELQELGKTVSQPFQLMPLTDRRIPAATRELLLRLPPGKRQLERFSSEQEIEGYSLAADILTGERFAVRMTAARSFTAEGRRVTGYFVWALFGVGALLITTMLLLLNRTVLLPLKSLSGKVSCLDFTQPDTLLTEPDGAELNNLARSINGAMGFLKQARQEAESATRAKSRFLATMTHELRTPLNAILGLSESLLARLRGPLTDEQSAALQSIHGSGEHLLSLINDILDISKIEANKMELFLEEISLQELCEECIGYMTAPAAAKGITLISGSTEAPRLFRADRRRMKQILLNLLDNAVKFTPRGGSVQLEVTGDPAGGGVRFAVRDSGIGIGEAQQQELFHPFTQVDDSLSRRHEGTGLGLALVAQLTALHHGSVTVASRPAEGSCFTVTIPLQAEGTTATCRTPVTNNQSPVAAPASAVTVSRSRLILLAEDNQVAFDMVASYLQGEGYRIIGAGSGDEAVALTERELPALVLMDIRMPGMSGIEAIRRIRELPSPAGEIPLIALTAQASPEERERCLAAGADAFVSKPIRLRQLTEIIGNLLGARSVSEHQ